MQTFLPYPNFWQSAAILDRERLGKQRVEAFQILKTLTRGGQWRRHPTTLMWELWPEALAIYGGVVCLSWQRRGYKDTVFDKLVGWGFLQDSHAKILRELEVAQNYRQAQLATLTTMPAWLGWSKFHRSHQSNLIRKAPAIYRPIFGDDVPDNLPYEWPLV